MGKVNSSTIADPALRYAGLVFWVWKRYYRQSLLDAFTKEDMQDWRQEAYTIALELFHLGYTEEQKGDILAYAQRRWYEFLRNMGYAKPKHHRTYVNAVEHYVLNKIEKEGFIDASCTPEESA